MKKNFFKLLVFIVLLSSFFVVDLALADDPATGEPASTEPGESLPAGAFTDMKETLDDRFQSKLQLPDQTTDPVELTVNIINILLGVLGLIAVVLIIYGGFTWMTAGGNADNVTKAKDIIKNALIGLAIILLAYIMVNIVLKTIINIGSGKGLDGEDISVTAS